MFRKILYYISVVSIISGAAMPALAQNQPEPILISRSACMKSSTSKKIAAYKAAKEAYLLALRQAKINKNKPARAKARGDYRQAIKAAKEQFAKDRNECLKIKDRRGKDKDKKKDELRVMLDPQNNSGVKGKAELEMEGGKLTVEIKLDEGVGSPIRPSHIHSGSCASLGGVLYPLINIEKGKSVTKLDTSFEKLKSELPLAVNVHKSIDEAGVYVACGDIKF